MSRDMSSKIHGICTKHMPTFVRRFLFKQRKALTHVLESGGSCRRHYKGLLKGRAFIDSEIQDSLVGTATRILVGLQRHRVRFSAEASKCFSAGAEDFSLRQSVQIDTGARPASCSMNADSASSNVKRPGACS
jgi:hypothetical protein